MMTQTGYRYFIRSGWKARTETPAAIGSKFLKTLTILSDIDPIFANWVIFDGRNISSFPFSKARARIAAVVENNVVRDDYDEPEAEYGYHASAMAGEFKDPRSVSFHVQAGGKFSNNAQLEFGDWDVLPDSAVVTYPLFKVALLAINAIWLAPWACAQAFRSGTVKVPIDLGGVQATRIDGVPQVPTDPDFPDTIFHIPWIAYLSKELSAGLKLAPEILTERTADGGLLMSATTERFDPTNSEHLRRSRILAETLIACTDHSSQ